MKKTIIQTVRDSVRSPTWVFSGKPIWDSVDMFLWNSISIHFKNFPVNTIHNSIDDFTKRKLK